MGNESLEHKVVDESMEEILSSIRKIMSADIEELQEPKTKKTDYPAGEVQDVLELTKRVDMKVAPRKNITDILDYPKDDHKKTTETYETPSSSNCLISQETLSASVSALSQLNTAPHLSSSKKEMQSLEDFVGGLLRPMLKDWLDKNLPRIVESAVQKEIQSLKKHL